MRVEGQWLMLLFHPHLLYQIRLEGLHVRIPPAGTIARGMDFDDGVVDTSQSKMKIETIYADGTVLDFLRKGDTPIRFLFPALQIHDLAAGRPMQFALRVTMPGPQGTVMASGAVGPFRTSNYMATPLAGTYRVESVNLSRLHGLAGFAQGQGRLSGIFSRIQVDGVATIPDFRAGDNHTVRLEAQYQAAVNGLNADVQIENAQVKTGRSVITASGTVAGSPRQVALTFAAHNAEVQDLLRMVETSEPQMTGKVNLKAQAKFIPGPQPFPERLQLNGDVAVEGLRFVDARRQQKMDAFSARVRKDDPPDTRTTPEATLAAQSETHFDRGIAYFPEIRADLPGAQARLHGTFNLLDYKVHLTGKVALQRGISHAATGWKALLLKPLSPFFRKKNAGAVVPVAVTGTAIQPRVGANLFGSR